jgi:hypothetical protein
VPGRLLRRSRSRLVRGWERLARSSARQASRPLPKNLAPQAAMGRKDAIHESGSDTVPFLRRRKLPISHCTGCSREVPSGCQSGKPSPAASACHATLPIATGPGQRHPDSEAEEQGAPPGRLCFLGRCLRHHFLKSLLSEFGTFCLPVPSPLLDAHPASFPGDRSDFSPRPGCSFTVHGHSVTRPPQSK